MQKPTKQVTFITRNGKLYIKVQTQIAIDRK